MTPATDRPRPSSTAEAPAPPKSDALAAWRVILVGVLTLTVALGQLYVVLPMLPELALLPGAGAASVALAVTAFALPYAVGFLAFGPLVDRLGPRAVMIASMLAVLAGTLVAILAPAWPLFIVGRAVQGLAAAPFTPAILVLIQTRVTARRRLITTSAVISAGMASAAISQVVAQVAVPAVGVSGVFGIFAAALAACLVLVRILIPRTPPPATQPVDISHAYRALPKLLRRRRLVLLLLVALSYLTVFVGLYAALQLADRAGGGTDLLVIRLSALPAIVAVPLVSPLLARVAGRIRVIVSLALAAATTAMIGILALSGVLTLLAFAAGMLLAAGAIAVAAPATVTAVMADAPDAGGAANALYSTAIFGGASIGTPLAGAVVSVAGTGDAGLGAFALSCAVIAAAAVALAVAAFRIPPSLTNGTAPVRRTIAPRRPGH